MSRINIWIVLLLVSVLVNGVLFGAGARSWFAPEEPEPVFAGDPPPGPRGDRISNLRDFVEALPADVRADVREQAQARFAEARPELRRLSLEAMQARRNVAQVMAAEPFDPEAAAQALANAREARGQLEARTEQIVLEVMAVLPPDVRRAALRDVFGRPGGRRPPGERPPPGQRRPPPGG